MLTQPGAKKAVALLSLENELKTSVVVAEASTKAMGRAILTGTIPIVELGLVVAFSLLIASIPIKLIRRLNNA